MQINIKIESYTFNIEIEAVIKSTTTTSQELKIMYIAKALNASTMSFFEHRAEYSDTSIEGCISKISFALKLAIEKQSEI